MNMDAILGLVRHALTVAGGAFVASGTLTGSEVEQIVGAIVTLIGAGWSVYSKRMKPA